MRRVTFHVSKPPVFGAGLENEQLDVSCALTARDPSLNLR